MNRYEYFEKWMTVDEWRTWKQQAPGRIREILDVPCNIRRARNKRRLYLMEEVNFRCDAEAIFEFEEMTELYVRWVDTPQGHTHWNILNQRTGPIR